LLTKAKILSLDELERVAFELQLDGRRIIMCHGTFDLLHAGHIRHLQRAKQEGDFLIVTLTGDKFVNKGPGRPVFGEDLRAESLSALDCVDFVGINHAQTAIELIGRIRPNLYVKGSDYRDESTDVTGNIELERLAVEANSGKIFYTDEITFSSSSLLNEHFGTFSKETKSYLQVLKKSYSCAEVTEHVKSLSRLKVLVVGDAIIDQYHYIRTLGQVGKGTALSVKYEGEEQFAGGAIAVANHLASFSESVTLVTGLGKLESHEEFILSKLLPNVTPVFSYINDDRTVTKRRFVDADLNKLFEVYFCTEEPLFKDAEYEICMWLEENLNKFDVVIVPDFGNGFISNAIIDVLCKKARYLAVNTQINSGNRGYHVINRYSRVDFASINEPELRLAAHNRNDSVEVVAELIGKKILCEHIAVTRGPSGVFFLDRISEESHIVPALSTKVIDRIGAGDAFLSLAGLCLGGKLPAEIAAFVGSVAAALDVQIICNREPVGQASLLKYIATLFK